MNRWLIVVVAYAVLALGALCARWFWLDAAALSMPNPWLGLDGLNHVFSALLGLTLGGGLVLGTRASVGRYVWASRLHIELRPLASDISPAWIWLLAALSAIGEELLFRGVLQPTVGLVGQAVLFGLVHQIPGKSRWVWALWAGLVGAALGALWELTGSLVGPILAHAVVNAMNLKYLKAYDPREPARSMGGLLNQRG